MRRDLLTSVIAVVFCTVVFGLAYPLAMTGRSADSVSWQLQRLEDHG